MDRFDGTSVFRFFAMVFFVFLVTSAAYAQILNIGDDTSTPVESAGHDYIKMLSETVNPANGSVSLRIEVPVAKGRGITVPFCVQLRFKWRQSPRVRPVRCR